MSSSATTPSRACRRTWGSRTRCSGRTGPVRRTTRPSACPAERGSHNRHRSRHASVTAGSATPQLALEQLNQVLFQWPGVDVLVVNPVVDVEVRLGTRSQDRDHLLANPAGVAQLEVDVGPVIGKVGDDQPRLVSNLIIILRTDAYAIVGSD